MMYRSDPINILIVEDDLALGQVLARVLTCEGRRALHVRDSRQAMRLLEQHSPRLVLLDTCLRDGTALKLFEAICTNYPALPIILLMAHRLDQPGFPSRVRHVVTKSIDLPELRRTVEAALCEDGKLPVRGTPDPIETSIPPHASESPAHAPFVNR
jgi:DNA-binding response OmpR family regulator